MKTNVNLFWVLTVGFFVIGSVYAIWTLFESGWKEPEWVGTLGIILSGVLFAFIAFYLGRVFSAQGGELPEDRLDANIDDGDPEIGHFSPWSWWPIMLGASCAVTVLGLAIGPWISFIGVAILLVSIVGWVYEYYRGYFAR